MLLTEFRYIWTNGFRGEEILKSANQKQESLVAAMFVNGLGGMSNLYRGTSICFLKKKFFCGKGNNSNLNIDISKIQLAMN
jgi:hypothetical protein